MIQINDIVVFDETKPLNEQTIEFSKWYGENVSSKISLETTPIGLDGYSRPLGWVIDVIEGKVIFHVEVRWIYQTQSKNSWACESHEVTIRKEDVVDGE
jgi:hypothetical protein